MFALGNRPSALAVMAQRPPAAPPPPVIAAVAANGWQGTMTAAAELAFLPIDVVRQGFDAAGAAITVVEQPVTTKRVRQPFPNQASLTAASVALSDHVYATDAIAGCANNSAEISPKPIAAWIMPHRLVVGNTLEAEVATFHRNAAGGRQVACVEFIASDGTNVATARVAEPTVSNRSGDRNAVVSYKAVLDILGLNPGLVTLNARVYPRIGGAASIADSAADGNAARGFSPRYFLMNAGAKTYAYVKTPANGGGAAGVVSSNAATAAATPFDSVLGALNALHSALAGTSGLDMAEIRIGDDGGTPFVLGSAVATRTQRVAALTITRDPAVARASARVSFGAVAFRPQLGGALAAPLTTGALRFLDLAIVRTGLATVQGEGAAQLEIIFDQCSFDNGGHNATWLASSHDYHFGTSFANCAGNAPLAAASFEHRLLRGIDLQPAFVSGGMPIEGWCVVGCTINNPAFARGARSSSGGMVAFNRLTQPPTTAIMLSLGQDQDVAGYAIVQNVIEYVSATGNAVLRISGDAATGNNSHVVIHHNTFAGAYYNGRWNAFYDDGATRRTSKLQSVVGNIAVSIFTKSDVFRGVNESDASGAATGNWAFKHGVGCRGNMTQYPSIDPLGQGSNQAQDWPGLGAGYGTSTTVRNDPLFADYRGATVATGPTYGAGAGGGDYALTAPSVARAMVRDAVLGFDFGGAARDPGRTSAGAYA